MILMQERKEKRKRIREKVLNQQAELMEIQGKTNTRIMAAYQNLRLLESSSLLAQMLNDWRDRGLEDKQARIATTSGARQVPAGDLLQKIKSIQKIVKELEATNIAPLHSMVLDTKNALRKRRR